MHKKMVLYHIYMPEHCPYTYTQTMLYHFLGEHLQIRPERHMETVAPNTSGEVP